MKLKIVGDGTPKGTTAVDAVTGEALQNVHSIKWEHDQKSFPIVTIVLVNTEVDVKAWKPLTDKTE